MILGEKHLKFDLMWNVKNVQNLHSEIYYKHHLRGGTYLQTGKIILERAEINT